MMTYNGSADTYERYGYPTRVNVFLTSCLIFVNCDLLSRFQLADQAEPEKLTTTWKDLLKESLYYSPLPLSPCTYNMLLLRFKWDITTMDNRSPTIDGTDIIQTPGKIIAKSHRPIKLDDKRIHCYRFHVTAIRRYAEYGWGSLGSRPRGTAWPPLLPR